MTNTFSLAFLLALALMVALRLWLSQRQISHVLAHRAAVPAQFANRLELAAHQKAADYTVTRTRFGRLALAVEVAVLLAFTFGGGLQALHDFWSPRLDGLSYGVALIFSVMAVSGIIDLPLSLYRQFVIEEKFGFNRMTPKLFVIDLIKQTLLGAAIGTPVILAILWLMAQMGNPAQNTALGLILFFLAVPVFTFLLTPLSSVLSRRDEFEADRYAATHASADDLVHALVKLYEDNAATLTPDPLHSLFYDSHPPASLRIARLQGG